jgi:uncharacterized membrane protein YidH (DUF202 family)
VSSHPVSDPDEDRGLARERTALSWTRTALSFGALGGVILKSHALLGLVVLGFVPVIWQLGRLTMREVPGRTLDRRMRTITSAIIVLAVVALVVSFLGRGTPLRLP